MKQSVSGISILVPINSNIEYIEDSLNSIINQTYKNWEIIIGAYNLPNNSLLTDIISKINIDKAHDINVIYIDTNHKATALNKMKENIKYDYVALLENGNKWENNKLELQIPFIGLYDVIGTNYEYFGDNIVKYPLKPSFPINNLSDYNFFIANPIINSSAILKATDAIWNENEELEDYDLWFKLYFSKKSFYNINEILCKYRVFKEVIYDEIYYIKINKLKTKWFNYINSLNVVYT
jgi:hypothetical protein